MELLLTVPPVFSFLLLDLWAYVIISVPVMDVFMRHHCFIISIQKETQESGVTGCCDVDLNGSQLDFLSLLIYMGADRTFVRFAFLAIFKTPPTVTFCISGFG